MNSNCDTPSNRTAYMLELMRYIRVDVRGKCGNSSWNQSSTESDRNRWAKQKTAMAGEYLFTIAIENSLEYDYVTEKVWQPLAAGSVPIYLGAPNIDEWLPCSNYSCIIHLRQFTSVKHAAQFIRGLVKDRERYTDYHRWRSEKEMRPSFMKMINYFEEANKHSIECLICDMVHRSDHGTTRRKLLAANNPFSDAFPSLV
jgi:alpha-1,3-fucosyltransferase 10